MFLLAEINDMSAQTMDISITSTTQNTNLPIKQPSIDELISITELTKVCKAIFIKNVVTHIKYKTFIN